MSATTYWSVCLEGGYPIVRPHANAIEQKDFIRQRIAEGADSMYLDIHADGMPHMGRVSTSDGSMKPLWI